MADIGKDIALAKQILEQGKVVAIPTETVYGLAANALDEQAVASIFAIKERPSFDPLIVHVTSLDTIKKYSLNIPEKIQALIEHFSPGPITYLLPKKEIIPNIVTSGLDTVGLRIPAHPTTIALLEQLDFPLAAPSANPFGYISPTTPEHVNEQLGRKIDYILDGGQSTIGIESTIVGIDDNDEIVIHRLGGISIEAIEKVVGKIALNINHASNPKAPGQLLQHYAPKKPFLVGNIAELIEKNQHKKIGVLSFGNIDYKNIELNLNLSTNSDLTEAACNLFTYMRQLDQAAIDVIITDFVPNIDLGKAINDRITRAKY
ncbi:MAG: threonylcarbamoyl-AMP synthase [Chitinophagales bacterium]|nr:threonylcarbamoyl-AMP synthase [Chitinophagales bacterium]